MVVLLIAKFAMLVCLIWYLKSLAKLAAAAGKQPWLWVFLTFLTTLLGMLVSFVWMQNILKRQRLI